MNDDECFEALMDNFNFNHIPKGIWIDRKGNEHKIKDMETSYINNVIAMFRNVPELSYKIEELQAELAKRNPVAVTHTIIPITEKNLHDLLKLMKVKIPKGKGAFYLEIEGRKMALFPPGELSFRYTTERKL